MTTTTTSKMRLGLSSVGLGLALGFAFLSAVGCASAHADTPAGAKPAEAPPGDLLPVGSPAPAIKATAHNGEQVDLAKMKGQYVVFYFYPKDFTGGCTKQACDIRDNWSKLKAAGVTVYGVSTQDNESHKKFAAEHKLPFALLPDDKGEIAKAFGVPTTFGLAKRVSFLIGKDGKIKYVWPKAATTGHAAEILAQVEAAK
jgi:peroxiredoxin Q/BCP